MATQEQVQEARERVDRKRAEVRKARYAEQQRSVEVSNDLTVAQLEAEEARLDAQLAGTASNKSEIKDASSDAFETATAQRKSAEATAKARDKE